MARVTTERMQGTEEEQNAPVTSSSLDERIKAAREQRDRLLKEQELRQIEEHIQLLERAVTHPTPIIPTTSTTELSEQEVHSSLKRSTDEGISEYPIKRTMRPRDPELYRGLTVKEHKEFC